MIGIDLISKSRAARFLKLFSSQAYERLFTEREKNTLHREMDVDVFSRCFAAKEAFFKALGESWMGLDGFARFEMESMDQNRFKIQTKGHPKRIGEGKFFYFQDHVGAHVQLREV